VIDKPQTIVAQLAGTGISGTVFVTYECKRIGGLNSADSAVLYVAEKILHLHFYTVIEHSKHENLVPVIDFARAAISATIGENEFIPAQGLTPVTFETCRTLTIAAVTHSKIKANDLITLVLVAGCIDNR